MAVNAPYGVLVWMFWCYITEACNYINFNQLNQQENLHILERKKDRKTTRPIRTTMRPHDDDLIE